MNECPGLAYKNIHSVKSVRTLGYSGPHFPAFRLNTERYGVFLRIQSICGKLWTRITPNTDTFQAVIDTLVLKLLEEVILVKTLLNCKSFFSKSKIKNATSKLETFHYTKNKVKLS